MSGYSNKEFSLPNYSKNKYRDVDNMMSYPEACDIYALGELLSMIINLYHFYWNKSITKI